MTVRPDPSPQLTLDASGASITPTDVSQAAPRAPSAGLAAMRTQFLADFADGLIGEHHNSYEHRSRVLRQSAARESES